MSEKLSYEELRRRVRELEETLERFSRQEQSIRSKLDRLKDLSRIDGALRSSSDLDIVLWEVLGQILDIFRCDRAWLLYPCDPDASAWEIKMERTAPAYPGAKEQAGSVAMTPDVAEVFRTALNAPGPVIYGPEGLPLGKYTKSWRVQSKISMALRLNRDRAWQFGVHQCSYPRVWSDEEKALFQEAGYRITTTVNRLAGGDAVRDRRVGTSASKARELEDLRAAHANLQALIDHTDDFALVSDREGRPVLWNRAYADVIKQLLGVDMKPGLQPHKLLEDPEAVAWWDRLHRRALGGEKFRVEYAHGEGSESRHFEVSYNPIREAGEVVGFSEFTRDITERRQSEEALRESEMRYRELVASLPLGVAEIAVDGTILSNAAHDAIYAAVPGELSGRNVADLLKEEKDRVKLLEFFRMLAAEEPEDALWAGTGMRKDGVPVDIRIDWGYRRNTSGAVTGFSAIITDVTERRRALQALRDSEEKFRKFAEESPHMIFIESGNKIVYVNRQCEALMGYGRMDYYHGSFSFADLVAPHEREKAVAAHRRLSGGEAGEGGEEFDCQLLSRTGSKIDAIVASRLVSYRGGAAVLSIITDITERRMAEMALQVSEERYRSLVEQSHEIIFTLDGQGRFVMINAAFEAVTGWSVAGWMGRHLRDMVHPDDHKSFEEGFAALSVGEKLPRSEIRILSKSGALITIAYSSVPIMKDNVMEGVWGIARDVTMRRKAEEDRQSLAALREREGVSRWLHDHLGADLYNVVLLADSIQRRENVDPVVEQQLEWITETSRNALSSIRNYLDFVGSAGGTFTELVKSIEQYGASVLKPLGIIYSFERRGDLAAIKLSAVQAFNVYLIFKEALTNVIKHARASRVAVMAALEEGVLSIVVEDNGTGIAPGESSHGHGRMNIRARADELGAGLAITSIQEGGTRVSLSLTVPR